MRRSSAKCIEALIGSSLCDTTILKYISSFLLSRFREREESVLLEILSTYKSLAKKSHLSADIIAQDRIKFRQLLKLDALKNSKSFLLS